MGKRQGFSRGRMSKICGYSGIDLKHDDIVDAFGLLQASVVDRATAKLGAVLNG